MKWLKRIAFALVALVTLAALVLAIEGYRAKRAWEACKQALAAKGESLDWQALAPAPVPDEQNFLATPLLARCFGFGPDSANRAEDTNACDTLSELFQSSRSLTFGNWRTATVTPLEVWQTQLRGPSESESDGGIDRRMAERYGLSADQIPARAPASTEDPALLALRARPPGTAVEDLRFLLEQERAVLDELRAAGHRPHAQLKFTPAALGGPWMDQLARLKSLMYPPRTAAWTELVAGNPEAALTEIETMLKVCEAGGSQPLLIAGLVKLALVDLTVQTIWAGLAEHRWPDAQLIELERHLARMNQVADMQRSMRGERAFSLAHLLVEAPSPGGGAPVMPDDPTQNALRHWPSAFVYRNQINIARAIQTLLIDRLDPAGPSVRLIQSEANRQARKRYNSRTPYNVFAALLLPAYENILQKAASGQAGVSLARIACALERHRLADGHYPERLDELVPRFLDRLPPDPVNGEPMKYRREAPDRFVIYSIALNLKDDGGVTEPAGKKRGETPAHDWVWRSEPAVSP